MKSHKQQARALKKLGISHRAAARDLFTPHATLSTYLLCGRLPARLKDGNFSDRVDRYIEKHTAREPGRFSAAPMRGKFQQLKMSLEEISGATRIDRLILKRGVYEGRWPDRATYNAISGWTERQLNLKEGKRMLTQSHLSQEVLEHWNLKHDPFSGEIRGPEDTLRTKELERVVGIMVKTASKPGWLTVTGEVGSGKSTAVREFRDRVAKKKEVVVIEPRIIQKELLAASHILDAVFGDMGARYSMNRNMTLENKARLLHRTAEESLREGKRPVILIDEAHLLSDSTLLCLKRIFEVAVGYDKFTAVILVGQPLLARRLKNNFNLTEAAQRITLYEIGSLNGAIGSYLRHKMDRAGCAKEIFDPSSIKAISKKADTPLAVNCVASAGLLRAYEFGERHVTAQVIEGI